MKRDQNQDGGAGVHSIESEWNTIFERLKEEIRIRNYSQRTFSSYANWIGRFQHFIEWNAPETIEMNDVKAFLSYLAVRKKVSASTQNQAFNALLFLFRHILNRGDEFDAKAYDQVK